MTKTALIAGAVATVVYASCIEAAVYKCTGADGKVAYQDAPCPTNASEQAIKAKAPPPPAATAKKASSGNKTTSTSKVDQATAAKAKSVEVRVAPDAAKAKDRAPVSPPAPDAAKSTTAPGK